MEDRQLPSVNSQENKKESGQAVVEYIVILAIAVSVALPLSKQLLAFIDGTVSRLGVTLQKKLHTGRVEDSTWND